jgi:hypothetical protein
MAAPPLLAELHEHRWLVIAGSFLALYAGYKIQAFRRLSAFGGPFGVGFTSIPHSWSFLAGRSHLFYKEAIDAYGELTLLPLRGIGDVVWNC